MSPVAFQHHGGDPGLSYDIASPGLNDTNIARTCLKWRRMRRALTPMTFLALEMTK